MKQYIAPTATAVSLFTSAETAQFIVTSQSIPEGQEEAKGFTPDFTTQSDDFSHTWEEQ